MSDIPQLTAVREAHRFDEARLADYLRGELGGDFSDLSIRQFEGGQSNPTYRLQSAAGEFVLRKKPPGVLLKSAHAVEREYRVMRALAESDVPVPRTTLLCEDESIIGTPFFLMQRVVGRVFGDPWLGTLIAQDRTTLVEHFIDQLAGLHSVDYHAVGLDDFGRPGNYFVRQIGRWTKQYLASKTTDMPVMDKLVTSVRRRIGIDRAWRLSDRQLHRRSRSAAHRGDSGLGVVHHRSSAGRRLL